MNTTEAAKELLDRGFFITFHSDVKVCAKAKYFSFEEIRVAFESGTWYGSGYKVGSKELTKKDNASSLDELLSFFISDS